MLPRARVQPLVWELIRSYEPLSAAKKRKKKEKRTGTAVPEALRNSPLLAVPTERGLEEGASDSQGDAGWRTRVCRVTSRSSFVGRQHASTRGRVSGCNQRTPVTGMGAWVREKHVRVWCVRTTAVSFCGSCSENGVQLGMW